MNSDRQTILLVDDSPEDRVIYRRYLQHDSQAAYEILEADSAESALEICQNWLPDAILLDYSLPDMDGLECLEALGQQQGKLCVPVVMLTGQGNETIAVQAIKQGAQDYLVKGTLTADILCRTVTRGIEQFQLQQRLIQQQQQQQIVAEMTLRIRQSLDLQTILQTTVDEVQQFLQVDRVIIFRFTPDWGGTVVVESVEEDAFSILQFHIYDPCIGEQFVGPFQQGLVTAKADIYNADISSCHVEFLAQFQVRANLVVPILKNNELWGLLVAHHCTAPRVWQDTEIGLLQQLAAQVGIALQQAALFQQLQTELEERQQTEAVLQEREALLRLFVQSAPAGIAMFDCQMHYVMASQRWVDEYRLSSIEALLGRSHYELFPDLPARWQQIYQRCLAGATEQCDEELWVRADGLQQWIAWEIRPWHTATGEIGGIIIFSADITQRKVTEVALQESQMQLQRQLTEIEAIYQSAPVGLSVLDTDLRFVRINQRLAEMNGFAIEAHLGCTLRALLPDLAAVTEPLLRSLLETGEPLLNVEITGETPAQPGVQRTWLESFLPLKAGDRVIGISNVCEEITARKQAEETLKRAKAELEHRVVERTTELQTANDRLQQELVQRTQMEQQLRQSEARYRAIVEDQTELITRFTPDSTILFVNDAFCRYFNLKAEDILGKSYAPVIYEADRERVTQLIQSITVDNPVVVIENRVIDGRGEVRWTQWVNRLLLDVQKTGIELQSVGRDITELKQVEQALRDSEERRRLALDLTHIGAWDMNLLNGSVIWNDNHFSLLGLEPYSVEPSYELWRSRIHPDDLVWVEPQFRESLTSYTDYVAEYRVIYPNGSIHWLMARAKAIYDDAGSSVRSLGVLLDVTDRKQAEIALQQQTRQEQLRWSITQAIRQSLDLNAILNTTAGQLRQTLQVDRVAIYRFQPDWSGDFIAESVGEGWIKLVNSGIPKVWQDTYLQATQGGRFQNHETFVIPDIYTAGLQRCHIDLLEQFQAKAYAVAPVFSGETLWGLLAIYQNATARDWQSWEAELLQQIASQLSIAIQQSELYSQLQIELQERKQTEAVLRETERRWRSLLDNVQLIVVGLDTEGKIEYANPFFLKLTGYPLGDVLGEDWFDRFLSPGQTSAIKLIFQEILQHNLHPHHQNPILTSAGEERIIAWSHTVLQDTSGQVIGMISIGEDITERYKIDRMKAEFISVVSHELRTPLTSMQAALSLLNDKIIDPLSEEGEATIQIATEGTDRLVRLVNDILDLERLESGKMRLEKHLYRVEDLINTAVAQMQEFANQSGIVLEANRCSDQVEVDGDRLLQVLTNLLSNAIKFSPNGSVVQLSVKQQHPDAAQSLLQFTVGDQGRGIPADKLESIFDRFHQVDASDSREKGGTGLGLAICRSIVQQHGGKIWVESTLGQGSTFYFTIPLAGQEREQSRL